MDDSTLELNRGDVWWANLPYGRHPVCILTRQAAIPVLSKVLVAPTTSTIRDIPTEVIIDEDDGMPSRCAISLDNMAVIPKTLFDEKITTLSLVRVYQVCEAMREATECFPG